VNVVVVAAGCFGVYVGFLFLFFSLCFFWCGCVSLLVGVCVIFLDFLFVADIWMF
jgi:hypothetical protein